MNFNTIFSVTFDIEASGRRAYREFIEDLRNRLAVNGIRSHDRPILRPEVGRPNDFFEIVLRTNHPFAVRFLFRPDNIYLVAYQVQVENSNVWLEFQDQGQEEHLVTNSTFLGFSGNYNALETVGSPRRQTPLGQDHLSYAVRDLATQTARDTRARSLLVVIQMTSEAIRFEDMMYFILNHYTPHGRRDERDPRYPDNRLVELQNSWGSISNRLLRCDDDPVHSLDPSNDTRNSLFPLRYMDAGEEVCLSSVELVCATGILKYSVTDVNHPPPPGPPRSSMLALGVVHPSVVGDSYAVKDYASEDKPQGSRLVEIYSVKIKGQDLDNTYGTITVTDGLMSQTLYNRDQQNSRTIKSGDDVLLTGPNTQVISASDSFYIDVSLEHMSDDHIDDIKGKIVWNVYNPNNICDHKACNAMISTKNLSISSSNVSSVMVTYGVYCNAVQAKVNITLLTGDNDNSVNVYGTLVAWNSLVDYYNYRTVLFNASRESGETLKIRSNERIQLSRSIVSVTLEENLMISAELHELDKSSEDDMIVSSLSLPAKLSGTSNGYIRTNKGTELFVEVTWAP